MGNCKWVFAGAAMLLLSGSALADTEYTSQSAFDAAVPGATMYAIPAPAGGQLNQDVGSSYSIGPATFTAGNLQLFNDGFYGSGQTYLGAFPDGVNVALTGTDAVGFNFGSFASPADVAVYVNGSLVDTIFTPGSPDSSFFGYVSSGAITSVSLVPAGVEDSELDVLNFETGSTPAPTPEPSSLALLGSAVAGGAATLRKRLLSR